MPMNSIDESHFVGDNISKIAADDERLDNNVILTQKESGVKIIKNILHKIFIMFFR